ncbi:YbaL family putative K(+) efflux transporter [Sphingosinicella sp. LHD-64]|uniref:YbaL family putative K(+) efflux transporter n=1 Tax=Sphingosinicella sp. LHD-64 TaxID=3072139 RepID=UPI00280D10CD|nr:YbaL family putative K(+) efflux transporter [Sphingosinicella sp. LHD-64]MDQ8756829.1 YbaL family putative K(+) efflux transporter [Sphingosinicella sp. LHD-64]
MPHHTPLIGTIVAGLVIAFALGALAHRLRMPPIVGYLLAGVAVGPFTPGFVADANLASELAEIGVILLMFGVGLHFSLRDLLSVKNIAVPGALVQIATATLMGMALAWALGWSVSAGFVFGLSLSVASTVVLLRALQSRDLVETERGRIAVGWLIVEDLAMVLALVLLPALANTAGQGGTELLSSVLGIVLKVAGFIAFMLVVGRRIIPWLLHWVVHTGSRELFRLAVLAIALGVAFGAAIAFDVSFALGAFFAGMILGETPLSRRATEETLPLRDAFAVLFFVSVGMLFNPAVITQQPGPLLATVAIIVVGKSVAAYLIVRAFGHPTQTAMAVSVSLAQIGEFSFILAGLGTGLGILPPEGRDLILAGAILSILVNPFLFRFVGGRGEGDEAPSAETPEPAKPQGHVILIGYGRVGRLIAAGLRDRGRSLTVIEDQGDIASEAADAGIEVVVGNATEPRVLREAGIACAAKLLIAIPEGFEGGAIAEKARALRPDIPIIARAHSEAEVEHLERLGAGQVVMAEREAAAKMLELVGTTT